MQGRILTSAWTTSTVNGQSDYSVPTDYLEIMALFLYQPTMKTMLPLRPIFEKDPTRPTGTPQRAFVHGANVSGNSSLVIILEPVPTSNGSNDLECWGRQLPKDMVAGGQGPEISSQWHDGLVHFAAYMAFMRLSTSGTHYLQNADREFKLWERICKAAKSYQNPLHIAFAQTKTLSYTPGHDYD